jgi:hypothetical protein
MNNINFEIFKNELVNELRIHLGETNVTISNTEITNTTLEIKTGCGNTSCNIYPFFLLYSDNQLSINSITDILKKTLSRINSTQIDKGKIIYRLVNQNDSLKSLNDIPHVPFHDMAITFVCLMDSNADYNGYLRITNKIMEENGLTLEELVNIAQENTFRLFPCESQFIPTYVMEHLIMSTDSTLEEFMSFAFKAYQNRNDIPTFRIGCYGYRYGSAAMLNTYFLGVLADRLDHNLLLLPASDRDFVAVPHNNNIDKEALENIVAEVLSQGTDPVITRHIYLFDRDTKELSIFQ